MKKNILKLLVLFCCANLLPYIHCMQDKEQSADTYPHNQWIAGKNIDYRSEINFYIKINANKHMTFSEALMAFRQDEVQIAFCSMCNCQTKNRNDFTEHMKLHYNNGLAEHKLDLLVGIENFREDESGFSCTEPNCSYNAADKNTVKWHKLGQHLKLKPYRCTQCSKYATHSRRMFNDHNTKKHKKEAILIVKIDKPFSEKQTPDTNSEKKDQEIEACPTESDMDLLDLLMNSDDFIESDQMPEIVETEFTMEVIENDKETLTLIETLNQLAPNNQDKLKNNSKQILDVLNSIKKKLLQLDSNKLLRSTLGSFLEEDSLASKLSILVDNIYKIDNLALKLLILEIQEIIHRTHREKIPVLSTTRQLPGTSPEVANLNSGQITPNIVANENANKVSGYTGASINSYVSVSIPSQLVCPPKESVSQVLLRQSENQLSNVALDDGTTSKKILPCQICTQRIKTWQEWKMHMFENHPNYNPFKCREGNCEFDTNNQDELVNHINNVHKLSRTLPCPFCLEFAGDSKQLLEYHVKLKHMIDKGEIPEESTDEETIQEGRVAQVQPVNTLDLSKTNTNVTDLVEDVTEVSDDSGSRIKRKAEEIEALADSLLEIEEKNESSRKKQRINVNEAEVPSEQLLNVLENTTNNDLIVAIEMLKNKLDDKQAIDLEIIKKVLENIKNSLQIFSENYNLCAILQSKKNIELSNKSRELLISSLLQLLIRLLPKDYLVVAKLSPNNYADLRNVLNTINEIFSSLGQIKN